MGDVRAGALAVHSRAATRPAATEAWELKPVPGLNDAIFGPQFWKPARTHPTTAPLELQVLRFKVMRWPPPVLFRNFALKLDD